ncbi:hypothetical protein PAHAL_5G478000 [Panicum hallii]|uniref:DUF674 domain-containing protein n=1 Tax=Panicum hallii TaxID=206008 RepID=A0A2S3HYI9_9POAL|nr:uncharacterized protein LOC112894544 [Panicum hallii]PAN32319.1 hypothetical protein PAHAL_5G478000 [Panicum hallii]
MAIDGLVIKLLIDTKAQKVCFAEAGNDVIELLSCLLCLPMGTVVNLLTKEHMVGSIGNVLDSMQELDAKYVCSSKSKEPYLSPTVAPDILCPLQQLLDAPLNVNSSVFTCLGKTDSHTGTRITCGYFSVIKGSTCPSCFHHMNEEMPHVRNNGFAFGTSSKGFVVGTTTYTISDALSITPASSVSSINLLARCGVKDLSTLQQRTVTIGSEEALEILLASLKSKTVLTDVFLPKKKVRCKKEVAA